MSTRSILLYRNELGQTFRELLAERIRAQGGQWHHDHDPEWRGKPWMDGIPIDVDEPGQVEYLVQGVMAVIRDAMAKEDWEPLIEAYFAEHLPAEAETAD